jgi:M6 family metalloprotease-like protein
MQWSSEASVTPSYLRNGSIFVAIDSQDDAAHRVVTRTKRLTTPLTKDDGSWTAIPDTLLSFNLPEKGEVAITFAGSLKMNSGDFLFIRPVIDGGAVPASPIDNTIADRSYHFAARSLTFTASELKAGKHTVQFEWKSSKNNVVTNATLGAFTVAVLTGPRETSQSRFDVVPLPSQATTTNSQLEPIPGLESAVRVDTISDIAVTFSAAFFGQGMLLATVTSDGVPVEEQEIIVYSPEISSYDNGQTWVTEDAGGQSYTFALKDVAPRAEPYRIGIAYRTLMSSPSAELLASAYNITMTVMSKSRVGPDLAVGANMGAGSKKSEAIIEPVHGTRKVLAVVIDPRRPDHPQADRNFVAGLDPALFGETPSAADYYKAVSGDRLKLEKAAILGPYVADKGGAVQAQNHYWDKSGHDPNGDGDCADSIDEYSSPYGELQAEALLKADKEFDFSEYDLDRNSVITANELAILIVVPQTSSTGSNAVLKFRPYCSGNPLMVDDVEIHSLLQFYTPGINNGATPLEDLDQIMVAVHELAHLILDLDDAYGPSEGIYEDGNFTACPVNDQSSCETRYINTAPQAISLMTSRASSPHLDGFHKVQLGWATPRIVIAPGDYTLFDVRQSRQVYILPRLGTDAREYILVESRYEAEATDDPLYDYSIDDSGLAVYHVIEPGPACKVQEGATAPSCVPLLKPMCITSDVQWSGFTSNFLRAGLRLIQPDLVHKYLGGGDTDFGETLWGTQFGVALLDQLPKGGLVCPTYVGDPLPNGGAPLLLWSDGSPSGYRLKEIKTDFAGKSVTFKTEINGK